MILLFTLHHYLYHKSIDFSNFSSLLFFHIFVLINRISRQRESSQKWINNPNHELHKSDSLSECLGWYIPDYIQTESNRELPFESSDGIKSRNSGRSKNQISVRSHTSGKFQSLSRKDLVDTIDTNGVNRIMSINALDTQQGMPGRGQSNRFSSARENVLSLSSSPNNRRESSRPTIMDVVRSRNTSERDVCDMHRNQSGRNLHDYLVKRQKSDQCFQRVEIARGILQNSNQSARYPSQIGDIRQAITTRRDANSTKNNSNSIVTRRGLVVKSIKTLDII